MSDDVAALKELTDAKFATINAVLAERAKGIEVAFSNFNIRLEGTNEWRKAFDDLTKTMASAQQLEAVKERVDKLEVIQTTSLGRVMGFGQMAGAIGWAVAVVVGLFSFLR